MLRKRENNVIKAEEEAMMRDKIKLQKNREPNKPGREKEI